MTDNLASPDIQAIAAGLAKAWLFLSGSERLFIPTMDHATTVSFSEFSYFMPLQFAEPHRTGGIGVLVDPADARAVATHMFGLPVEALASADLHDACAEVCNLFSDSIAMHIGGNADVQIGLPFLADLPVYSAITLASTVIALYAGASQEATTLVVVYHPFSQPN